MKPNSVPFWWVVKHRDGGYWATANGSWLTPGQAEAFAFVRRPRLGILRKRQGNHVVRVHARIPEPKLPAWAKPVAFQYQHVQVWRRTGRSTWEQHVFPVTSPGDIWVSETVLHTPTGAHRSMHSPIGIAPDVWAEAAQRAAKMLRARKAAR